MNPLLFGVLSRHFRIAKLVVFSESPQTVHSISKTKPILSILQQQPIQPFFHDTKIPILAYNKGTRMRILGWSTSHKSIVINHKTTYYYVLQCYTDLKLIIPVLQCTLVVPSTTTGIKFLFSITGPLCKL